MDENKNILYPFSLLKLISTERPTQIILSSWSNERIHLGSPTAKFFLEVRKRFTFISRISYIAWDSVSPSTWRRIGLLSFVDEVFPLDNPVGLGFSPKVVPPNQKAYFHCMAPLSNKFPFTPARVARDIDVIFLGQADSYRDYRLSYLDAIRKIECNSMLRLNSAGGRNLSYEEMYREMAQSLMGVNFADSIPGTSQLKGRVLETLKSGAMLLEQYNEQILEYFQPGKHFVFFSDVNSLEDVIKYYLKHPDLRLQIAEQGQAQLKRIQSEYQLFRHLI